VIKLSIEWLPIGVRECRHGAATDTCPNCNQPETMFHLYTCLSRTAWHEQFIAHLRKHLADTSTAADIRYLMVDGIQHWFLSGTTNDPPSTDPIVRIGWFRVLKGYIPHQWNISQETFYRAQNSTRNMTTANNGPVNSSNSSGRKAIHCERPVHSSPRTQQRQP
jgi:hypothetical protein